jgi:hypothetical protein
MFELKLSPLLLFVLLLLILVTASLYSSWAKQEGFESAASNTNPFAQFNGYEKNYGNLVNVDGNFWYDSKNGNIYRVTMDGSSGKILSVVVFDRFGVKTSYTPKTASDGPVSVISKDTISSFVGSWFTVDTVKKTQLNFICWNKNTYIYTFNITNAESTANPTHAIKRMMYYEGQELKTSNTLSENNVIALVSPETYQSSFSIDTGNDDTNVIEPLYDSSRVVYQITKNIKIDEMNGNLIVNVITAPVETPSASTTVATTAPTTAPTGTSGASVTPSASTTKSGFRNIEGFATTTTNTIDVYKRKVTSIGVITTPTNIYTEPTEKTLSATLENSSTPFFVNDPIGNNTIIYWPTDQKTLIVIMSNTYTTKLMAIPSVKMVLCSTNLSDLTSETAAPRTEATSDPNADKMMNDFTKWSQYMLKTEVVPPVCPACPSCNTGGLCTDCGGKGGCGTKSSDGKSLAITDDGNNIADVKGPSSAVASVGKSAGAAVTGTVDAAGNVVGGTVNAASNLVGGTVNAASNLVGGTVNAASNLVGGTIGTAANLLNSLASGDAQRVGYNQSNQTNGYNRNNTGIATTGLTANTPIDVYSYNGALQSKGSNFRPLTADFGAFSK